MLRLTLAALLAATPLAAQESVTIALDWTPNTNHVGLYVAQAKGWYDAAGIDVEILPYTDTASTTLVASGVAEFGVFSSISFYTNRAAGADLVATFAVVQRETGRLVFDAERADIQTPADLDGLRYAGFGTDWEEALISAIIREAGGEGRFETVTLGTSAYEALANGRVDFTLEVSTWEGVQAEIEGRPQRAFRYADHGIPDQHTTLIGARGEWLDANPQTARAFLDVTRRGYGFAAENPDEAAGILVEATEGMLSNPELVAASMRALVEGGYLVAEDGAVGRIDPAKVEAIGAFLHDAGILRDRDGEVLERKPDFSTWFTNAFLGG
jgi:ABC-type nitrate/sulfonate/bicarbonate transport system substrate-binding protein